MKDALESLTGAAVPFGSPHSSGPAANQTAQEIEAVRLKVLAFFGASPHDYDVVFTSGASGAMKLVAEHFPWAPQSVFAHSRDCHTSGLGVRAVAARHGASVLPLARGATAVPPSPPPTEGALGMSAADELAATCVGSLETFARFRKGVTLPIGGSDSGRGHAPRSNAAGGEPSVWLLPSALAVAAITLVGAAVAAGGGWRAAGFLVAASNAGLVSLVLLATALFANEKEEDAAPKQGVDESQASSKTRSKDRDSDDEFDHHLLCIPAESNFDGVKHVYAEIATHIHRQRLSVSSSSGSSSSSSSDWEDESAPPRPKKRRKQKWWLLVDGAKAASTGPLSAADAKPDMVAISFYKIFGHPTGELKVRISQPHTASLRLPCR